MTILKQAFLMSKKFEIEGSKVTTVGYDRWYY